MDRDYTQKHQIDVLWDQCHRLPTGKVRMDLAKMWSNCSRIWVEMDREFVECRKHNKLSPRYQTLSAQLNEAINNLEQYLVFANLLT